MTELRQAVAFTYDDLRSAPDDGYRRELVEGQLLVSPAPGTLHQRCVVELVALLRQTLPPHLEVSAAPVDVKLSESTVLEPDVLVVRRDDVGGPYLTRPPELVVEVSSPSTRLTAISGRKPRRSGRGEPGRGPGCVAGGCTA